MGLDSVTDQLRAQGINAEVAGHLSWQNEVAEILGERAAGRTGPLILVGIRRGPTMSSTWRACSNLPMSPSIF
jgi:hypothetical protein